MVIYMGLLVVNRGFARNHQIRMCRILQYGTLITGKINFFNNPVYAKFQINPTNK